VAKFRGIDFPFRAAPTGIPAAVVPDDLYARSIAQILLTRVGERVMLPEFGSNVHRLLFENRGPVLENDIAREVKEAIERWDDRIIVDKVEVRFVESAAFVKIFFRVASKELETEVVLGHG